MKFSSFLGLVLLFFQECSETYSETSFESSNASSSHTPKRHNATNQICPIPSLKSLLNKKSSQISFYKPFNKSNLLQKFPETINKCIPLNKNTEGSLQVRLLNNSQLLQQLSRKGNPRKRNHCTVVLFYAPWCPFSIAMTPHYHALARTFHQLDVVAVDAYNFCHFSSRYGAISVPTMIVFHDDKAFSKFNGSHWHVEQFVIFLNNVTGFSVNSSVELLESDLQGPLPTSLSTETDYYLWMAWLLICACVINSLRSYLRYTHLLSSLLDSTNYRATHHHID